MNANETIRILEQCENMLERLRVQLLNESLLEGKAVTKKTRTRKTATKEKEIETVLTEFNFPTDPAFINELCKTCSIKGLDTNALIDILKHVQKAHKKSPKDDIKKYIFACVNRADKS